MASEIGAVEVHCLQWLVRDEVNELKPLQALSCNMVVLTVWSLCNY